MMKSTLQPETKNTPRGGTDASSVSWNIYKERENELSRSKVIMTRITIVPGLSAIYSR